MALITVRLKYACIAEVVLDDSDRLPYVPPPVPRDAHAETCGCADCVMLRNRKQRGAA
jgi:hypothetical protein